MTFRIIKAAGLCLAIAAPAWAQTLPAGPPSGPPDRDAAPKTPPPSSGQQHDQHAPPADAREYPSLKISGFGNLDFSGARHLDGPRGFSEGQFVLHMASELSPRVTFFGEISLTPRTDAGTGSPAATGFNTEVERMIVRFDHNDHLKVSFGRYHTPINWWNAAFHHGSWLQTTITRPEMIQFGGRLLPIHFVGGLVEGTAPAHGWNFNYQAGIGNGRGSVISRAGDAGDNNDNRAWLANAFLKPDHAFGLRFGGSIYGDKISLTNGMTFAERIVSAHVVWQKEDPELIAEVAGVRHHDLAAGLVFWSRAYYVQVAYRLPGTGHLWKPYYRFEHVGVGAGDPVFGTIPNLDGSTAGVRYDISAYAAIKTEYRTWERNSFVPRRNHGGFFQVCFTF